MVKGYNIKVYTYKFQNNLNVSNNNKKAIKTISFWKIKYNTQSVVYLEQLIFELLISLENL